MVTNFAATRTATEPVWGIASAIDIYKCNPEKIRDKPLIKKFVVKLCDTELVKEFSRYYFEGETCRINVVKRY